MNTISAIRLLAVFIVTLSIAAFPGISTSIQPAHADRSPPRLTDGTQWVPTGAMVDKLQIQVYTDEIAEYNAMLQTPSQVDLGDWPVPKSIESTFLTDTRFYLSAPNSEFGMFDIDFNHANTFYGIADNHGNSAAGIEFRQAISHLIDKNAFISSVLGGLGNPMDSPLPPGQGVLHPGLPCDSNSPSTGCTSAYSVSYTTNGVSGSYSLTGPCAWDTLFPTGCISAFHYAADAVDSFGIVTASAANPDFCDAAQHVVAAGLANGVNAADCSVSGHQSAALSAGVVTFFIRSDNPPRQKLGTAIAARMCELFNGAGTTSCTQVNAFQGNIAQAVPAVFSTSSVQLGWHLYTAGWGLTPQFDQLYALYNSAFASTACGGKRASFGQDYTYYCRADYDHATNMLEFNDTTSGAIASAQLAMQIFGQTVGTVSIWSNAIEVPYAKSFTGINDASGLGPSQFFSTLNGWSPSPAVLGTLRWGFKQGTVNLNIFLATTQWEFYTWSNIYDSLIATAPYNATSPFSWLASSFTTVDATASPQCASVATTVRCIIFNLRPSVHFHDGVALTGSDVKFSMLAFKEVPGPISSSVAGIVDVTYVAGPSPGTQSVFVHLSSKSPFAIFNVGGVPILPQHIWADNPTVPCPGTPTGPLPTTGPCAVSATQATADPITNHLFIGTGPFACVDLTTAQVGGGCTRTASGGAGTQAVDAGGTIILQRFGFGFPGYDSTHSYFHGSRFYKVFQWADRLGQGTFNIVDVSNAGGCWNKPISTNPGCAHWVSPASTITCVAAAGSCNAGSLTNTANGGNNEAQMSIAEVSELGALWQVSWNAPIVYTTFAGAQAVPQTTYEGGITYSGSAVP